MESDTLPEMTECLTLSEMEYLADHGLESIADWAEYCATREMIYADLASIAAGRVTVH